MKLFSIKVTGGELVGYDIPKCDCDDLHECEKPCDLWNPDPEPRNDFKIRLSDVTEDMAKELGFEETPWPANATSKENLEIAIDNYLCAEYSNEELNSILLILIKDE